jgi:isoquinoline 1-oxidoreductase beta subunit
MTVHTPKLPKALSRRAMLQTVLRPAAGCCWVSIAPRALQSRMRQMAPERPIGPFAPDAFIRIDRAGKVTLIMPQAEMGQGVYTAMR